MAAIVTFSNAQFEVQPNPDGTKSICIHDLDSKTRYVVPNLTEEQCRATATALNAKGILTAPASLLKH